MIWPSKVGMVGLSIKKNRKSISSQKNSKKGFTLVELIVVLVILAIMAAAVIPALLGYTDHAKDKKYIETAKECLKASQTVLSDTFNDSANTITMEKRYSAADMANVYIKGYNDDPDDPKKVGTRFIVWTSQRLEATGYKSTNADGTQYKSAGTKATTENMGAYTIVYAAFDTGMGKYVVYDGKDWTVKEIEDEAGFDLASSAGVPTEYSKNIIHMWDYVNTDACDPSGYEIAGEDWSGKEGVTLTRKVNLHFINSEESHGLVLADGTGTKIEHDYNTYTLTLTFKNEDGIKTCEECNDLMAGSSIKVGGSTYNLKVEDGFKNLKWSTDINTPGTYLWDDEQDDLLGHIVFPATEDETMEPMDIYAWTEKKIEKRTANFIIKDSGNLAPVGITQTLTFCRYSNEYDRAADDGGYSKIAAKTEGSVQDATGQNGYEFAGWAHNVGSDYEKENGKLVSYNVGTEKIWKTVFATAAGETPTFTAIGELNKNILFNANAYSGFGTLSTKLLEVPIYKNDLTGEENDPDSIYNSVSLKLDYGFKFKTWVEVVGGEETTRTFGNDFSVIKDYVMSDSKTDFEFNIKTDQIRGALIIGGAYTNETTAPGAIRALSGGSPEKVVNFVRDSFGAGVSALGGESDDSLFSSITTEDATDNRLLGNLSAGGSEITSTIAVGEHLAVYETSGSIYRAAVLWDGNHNTYQAPIFAYSTKDGEDITIHWFSFEEAPEVSGTLSHTFDGFERCVFQGSGIDDWNMKNCTSTSWMFADCHSLASGNIAFTNWASTELTKLESIEGMFKSCNSMNFSSVDFTGFKMPVLTTMNNWVDGCGFLTTITLDKVSTPTLNNDGVKNLVMAESTSSVVTFSAKEWVVPGVSAFNTTFKNRPNLQNVYFNKATLTGMTTFKEMFNECIDIKNVDFSGANISGVTSFEYMFKSTKDADPKSPTDGFSYVETVSFEDAIVSSSTINMSQMFYHCASVTTINLATATTIKPSTCNKLFDQCHKLSSIGGLADLDTSKSTSMRNMFFQCESLGEVVLPNFNYDKVTDMIKMFKGAHFKEIDFSNRSFDKTTQAYGLFRDAEIKTLKLNGCDMSHVVYTGINTGENNHKDPMFMGATINTINFEGWKINIGDGSYMFSDFVTTSELVFDKNTQKMTSSVSKTNNMFANCNAKKIELEGYDLSGVTNSSYMFQSARTDNLSLKNTIMSHANNNAQFMFYAAVVKNIDLSGFDISGVSNAKYMFKDFRSQNNGTNTGTISFKDMTLSNLSGNNAQQMFYGTKVQSLDLSGCDMSFVTSFDSMFYGAEISSFSTEGWDITGATTMKNMFRSFKSQGDIKFANKAFSQLTNMQYTFYEATANSVQFDHCDLSKVTTVESFFYSSSVKSIKFEYCDMSKANTRWDKSIMKATGVGDISFKGTDISSATSLNSICEGCTSLKTVDMSEMNIKNVSLMTNMFKGCSSLTSAIITVYSEEKTSTYSMATMFQNCTSLTDVIFCNRTSTENVNLSCIMRMDSIFDNCTSYNKKSLEDTFKKLDMSTQYNDLFRQEKDSDGYNTLYTQGKCHSDFKTGTPVVISIDDGTMLRVGGGNSYRARRLIIVSD